MDGGRGGAETYEREFTIDARAKEPQEGALAYLGLVLGVDVRLDEPMESIEGRDGQSVAQLEVALREAVLVVLPGKEAEGPALLPARSTLLPPRGGCGGEAAALHDHLHRHEGLIDLVVAVGLVAEIIARHNECGG